MKQHKFIGLFIASLLLPLLLWACDPDEGDDAPGSDSTKTPAITNAAYNASTGVLGIVGTDLPTKVSDWDFTKLQIVGKGGASAAVTLKAHGTAATNSTTGTKPTAKTLTITFKGTHKAAVDAVLDKNLTKASDDVDYNLKANAGAFKTSAKTADATNAITVAGIAGGGGSSSPAVPSIGNTSTYDVSTALLTLKGSNLGGATQAQIRTITVDGVALDSYSADATATGANANGLAKDKYRIKTDGSEIWVKLTDTDKGTLNSKSGMNSNGTKSDKITVASGSFAGLDTAKDFVVSGNSFTATLSSIAATVATAGTYANNDKLKLTFSAPVKIEGADDVTVADSGTAKTFGTGYTVIKAGSGGSGSGDYYTIWEITIKTGNNIAQGHTITIASGKVEDAGGNTNASAITTTVPDITAPTFSIGTRANSGSANNLTIVVTFNEALHADTLANTTVAQIVNSLNVNTNAANNNAGGSSNTPASIAWGGTTNSPTLTITFANATELTMNKFIRLTLKDAVKDLAGNTVSDTTVVTKQIT